jgi:Phosphotransferase enzyme family
MVKAGRKRDGYTRGVDRVAEDRVSKFVGDQAEIEFQKSRAIELALSGTDFITPKTLGCNTATGCIDFEYVPHGARLFDAMLNAYQTGEVETVLAQNRRAAELLATLHRNLKLSAATAWVPPPMLFRELDRCGQHWPRSNDVFLHCDFSPVNILVDHTGGLVVIDASPNGYLTGSANLTGPPLVDLATYTVRLHWPFRARTYRPSWRRLANTLRADFLNQYEQSSGLLLDRPLLGILERNIVRFFVEWKTGWTLTSGPAVAMARLALPAE